MSKEIKTFEVDTWILFDRDSFNLKGYRYKFCEDKKDLLEIYDQDLPKLKEELSDYLFEWATDGSSKDSLIPFVYFSENDFQDTYNPFKGLHWEDYYKDLDIPKDWENISYGNDELPSFLYKDYQIWINSPLLSERKEGYLGIGFDNLDHYKDWIFTVCSYDKNDCECKDEIYSSLHLSEVINFLKDQD